MSNRYSKTGFTARQVKTLRSIRYDLMRIIEDRSPKQDSPKALELLFRADTRIMQAILEAEQWKKS
jgi:hypothetical protein